MEFSQQRFRWLVKKVVGEKHPNEQINDWWETPSFWFINFLHAINKKRTRWSFNTQTGHGHERLASKNRLNTRKDVAADESVNLHSRKTVLRAIGGDSVDRHAIGNAGQAGLVANHVLLRGLHLY